MRRSGPCPRRRSDTRPVFRCSVTADELVIGALARLVPQKGIDLLLAAAEELLPDFPHARLVIWGDGPERRKLERMARRLGLRRVKFMGETPAPWQAYAAMDIFCAPSRWEAGPYAVLEAMACGLPVVASEVAGHIDYLENGNCSFIASAELPGPLDGALRALLMDADERKAMGHAARLRATQEFTLTRTITETAALYREVAAKPPRA